MFFVCFYISILFSTVQIPYQCTIIVCYQMTITLSLVSIPQWASVCLNVPYYTLKTVCSCLVTEMKRANIHNPGLSIASAVSDRLGYLLPSNNTESGTGTVDRSLMYSEAARRDTFTKWPHMNYK